MASIQNGHVLVLGQGLHAPWNEGTRVIGRNLISVARSLRPVSSISLTHRRFRDEIADVDPIQHVFVQAEYGVASNYLGLQALRGAVLDVLRREPVEVAHLVGLPLVLAPWLQRRGIRVIPHLTLAQQVYLNRMERLRAHLAWRVFDRWVYCYALSGRALIEPFRQRGLPAHKLAIVPAAVDTDFFSPGDAEARRTARERLSIPDDTVTVCYIGTLSPQRFPAKQVREALERFQATTGSRVQLRAFAPDATHPYNGDWSETARRELAGARGIESKVMLRDLSVEEKREVYRAADVMVFPFAQPVSVEPPLTLVEAMSSGATAVVTPTANRSGLVRHRENGFVFRTTEELATALATATAETRGGQIDRLQAAARDRARREHSFAAAREAISRVWDSDQTKRVER